LEKFNYNNLRLAIEASENNKKAVDAMVQQFEQRKPFDKELLDKMNSILESSDKLLNRLKSNQSDSNNPT
jgi:hypothetical protein